MAMAAGVFLWAAWRGMIGWVAAGGAPMPSVSVSFANVPGTEAALGRAGSHTIIADRPDGNAGADRQPTAESLGEGHDVGRDAVVLVGEKRAGAAHSGLHLVEDK